jgi:branched-chain amino acid transport system permease protein
MITQFIINGVIAGGVYALVALGFSLIYGTVRFFHFAHGGIYTAGAYIAFALFSILQFSFWPSVILAVVLAGLLGALTEIAIYRPMRRRKASSTVLLISSLGLLIILQNLIPLLFGDATKTIRRGTFGPGYAIGDARITSIQLTIVGTSIALCFLTWSFLRFTRIGRQFRAVANDADLSTIVGVDSNKIILLAFVLGSILAAGAAILISLDTDITPTMGFGALLMGVVAAIVGGVGSIPGAMLGGLFVGILQQFGVLKLPTQWQDAVVFVILIVILIFRPQGFLGKRLRSTGV